MKLKNSRLEDYLPYDLPAVDTAHPIIRRLHGSLEISLEILVTRRGSHLLVDPKIEIFDGRSYAFCIKWMVFFVQDTVQFDDQH